MKRKLLVSLAMLLLMLPVASWSADVPLILDPMDGYTLGKTFSYSKVSSLTSPPTWGAQYYSEGARTDTVMPDPDNQSNKVLDIYDSNTDNASLWVYHYFKIMLWYNGTMAFDVMLPQNSASFFAKVHFSHLAQMPDNPKSWAAGIAFEGNQSPNGSGSNPGRISYQTKSVPDVWEASSVTYTPGTWYTVVIYCDFINKKYTVSVGPKGGPVSEITPAGGIPFVQKQDQPGSVVPALNLISFSTSSKTGGDPAETAGHMYVDNVNFHGFSENDGEWIQSMDDILKLPVGRYLELDHIQGRCAMVGTDQLGKPFFYLTGRKADGTMSNKGIRVRQDPLLTTVHQGDFVQVLGYIQRATDNGNTYTEPDLLPIETGEKEILAIVVESYPQGSALPTPRSMKNSDIGGGDLYNRYPDGNNKEPDGYPAYPGVFGSWIDANATPPTWNTAAGPNNAGTYGRFYGKVTYVAQDPSQPYWPYIYIDDGSGVFDGSLPDGTNPQKGVRVLLRKDRTDLVDFTKLLGKNVIVPGVIGAVSADDLLTGVCLPDPDTKHQRSTINVRVIRAIEEAFYDDNGNGYYDGVLSNDWNYDSNLNGIYDGILVLN